jgi:DNA polymerase III alpha subunit
LIDIYNLPSDDKTWDLLATGKTAGVFQLENEALGGRFSKKIQPKNIEEVASVITILRPGTLSSEMEDGESAAVHYERRHRGVEDADAFHFLLEPLLKDTQQIILYQEQIIQISKTLAGFDGRQAMKLMKGIGKKKADLIFSLEKDFIAGCLKNGVREIDSQKIFDIIKKSARYVFNKSHAVGYAKMSYATSYMKANHMLEFYVASLRLAKDKTNPREDVKKLSKECADFGFLVYPPRLDNCYVTFTGFDKKIYFGISNIKSIGETQAQLIVDIAKTEPKTWYECLFKLFPIRKTVVENCIKAGVFAKFKVPVRRQLDDYSSLLMLSNKEKGIAESNSANFTCIKDLLEFVKTKTMKSRVEKLDSIIKLVDKPAEKLEDNVRDTTKYEVELFGCSVSYDNIDCVTTAGNCTIEEYNRGKFLKEYQIVCEVERAKIHEISKGISRGKIMCFVDLMDSTGKMSCCLFDEAYDMFGSLLYEGSTVMVIGYRGKKKGMVIKEVKQVV